MTNPSSPVRRLFLGRTAATGVGLTTAGLFGASGQVVAENAPAANVLALPELTKLAGRPDEGYWGKVRQQFEFVPGLAFLNNGTLGPVPTVVAAEHERWDRALARDPRNSFRQTEIESVRGKLAALVNASPDEIAITHSTTEGVNIFAQGLDWRAGDEVILGSLEHRAVIDAYAGLEKRHGIKIVTVALPTLPKSPAQLVEAYQKAITPRTRLIVVSQVSYVNGLLAPVKELAELAHRRGLLISVDAAQSFGVVPLDVKALAIDHYAAPGQKWLLAGTGTGFSYFRQGIQNQVWPLTGFYDASSTVARNHTARRYEHSGQINVAAALGIGAAVDFHQAVGPANIEKRDRELSEHLRQGLAKLAGVKLFTPQESALTASLTSFAVNGLKPDDLVKALNERFQVFVRTINVGEVVGVRASTHFYNTHDEVERLLAGVRTLAA